MRKSVAAVILLLAVAFVVFSLAELQNVVNALSKANAVFLGAAFLFQIVGLYNTAATFGALYRLVGLSESRRRLFLMTSAANFLNVIAPSGGVGGIAVLLDGARRRGIASGRVIVVGVLYLIYEYAALLSVVALGLAALSRRHALHAAELIAAGSLLALALVLVLVLVLGYTSSDRLGRLLAGLARLANRLLRPFLRRDWLRLEAAHGFARDVAAGISTIRGSGGRLIWPLLFTLNNKALLLCVLASTFLALDTPFSAGTLLGGFAASYLFFYFSPTPSGVGFVEGVMPAALSALRVPLAEAVLITLAFRAVTLWFPLAVGGVAFRLLQRQPKVEGALEPEPGPAQ